MKKRTAQHARMRDLVGFMRTSFSMGAMRSRHNDFRWVYQLGIAGSKAINFYAFSWGVPALHQKSLLHRILRSKNRSLWSRKSLQNEAKKVLLTDGSAY